MKTHLRGDRETTGSTLLGMVIPSIEEEVEVEEDKNGSTKDHREIKWMIGKRILLWKWKKIRGEISQVNSERDQQDRQEEEWSVPTSIERREDDTVR